MSKGMSVIDEFHHFNELSAAEDERLALFTEECGEAIQAVGKIQRHGYESLHPDHMDGPNNRARLEKEVGDILAAIDMLVKANDLSGGTITAHRAAKKRKVRKYLHHQ